MTEHRIDSVLISIEDSYSRVLFHHSLLENKEIIKCLFDFLIFAQLVGLFALLVEAFPVETGLLQ